MEFLGIGNYQKRVLTYSLGEVKTAQIPIIHHEYADKTLYDQLTQFCNGIPKRIHDKPHELLKIVLTEADDEARGSAFEDFIGESFWRLGFQYKTNKTKGAKDIDQELFSFGSGDVALTYHFPLSTSTGIKNGYVIACEGKATSSSIGSRTIGQIESFVKRVKKAFPDYLIHQMIISRSYGYDRTASPIAIDIIHLQHEALLNLLKLQETLLKRGLSLITPIHIACLIENLIEESSVCPQWEEVILKLAS